MHRRGAEGGLNAVVRRRRARDDEGAGHAARLEVHRERPPAQVEGEQVALVERLAPRQALTPPQARVLQRVKKPSVVVATACTAVVTMNQLVLRSRSCPS
ncbi:MAG: hypothetical protein INH41_22750 [Myxococcaceae bacterium]|nr:hypothetical protein [Myxococcaceae bacterium]MCA3015218.1 hypothetical protein [Myxococcaceae bacterium]